MTRKLTPQEKKNRKPAVRACTFCHSKHLQCSNERPCNNCVKRNIAGSCTDIVRKRAKYMKTASSTTIKATSDPSADHQPIAPVASPSESLSDSVMQDDDTPGTTTSPAIPSLPTVFATAASPNKLPSLLAQSPPSLPFAVSPAQNSHHLPISTSGQTPTGLSLPLSQPTNDNSSAMADASPPLVYSPSVQITTQSTSDVINRFLRTDLNKTSNNIDPSGSNNQTGSLLDDDGSDTVSQSMSNFHSNFLNEEYLMLGDIILHSKPSSPSPSVHSVDYATVSENPILASQQLGSHRRQWSRQSQSQPSSKLQNHSKHLSPTQQQRSPTLAQVQSHAISQLQSSTSSLPIQPELSWPPETALPHIGGVITGGSAGTNKSHRPFISLGVTLGDEVEDPLNSNIPLHPPTSGPLGSSSAHQYSALNTEYVSPLVQRHIYQSVQDIYTNKILNFDYPQSYHSLTHFLKTRFGIDHNNSTDEERTTKRKNLLQILKLIASYRPTFILAYKNLLIPHDLELLEILFQRCLFDHQRLMKLNSSPTIMWRRTGEIVSISDDMLSLLEYNINDILSQRRFILELMYDDESILNYFKLFKSVAVGNLHSSIVTKCNLKTKSSDKCLEFCCVWTVKRDLFDLPSLMIGQFLPVLPIGDGFRMY